MKTILWKELRENARWIPLGAIATIIVLILKWSSSQLVFDTVQYGGSPSLGSLIGVVATGVAVCLGALQSWPDQRPAARALLLHRGITADAAFCGKLLAGLLLYSAAVFVPLLGMAAFIAAVGVEHCAASPGALLPSALMGVAAFSCWPAAMLVVQRDAWFLGSRLFPAATAGVAVLGCGALMNEVFWLAIVITALTLVCFLAAARSVFVNSSQVASGSGRAATAIIVTVALLIANMFLMSMVQSYQMRASAISRVAVHHQYLVELGPDGRPWLTRSKYVAYAYEVDQVAAMEPGRSVRDQLQPKPADWKPLKKWSPYLAANYRPMFGRRFAYLCALQIPAGSAYIHRSWVLDRKRDAILVYRIGADRRYHLEATLPPPAAPGSFGELRAVGNDSTEDNATLVTSRGVFRLPGEGSDVELMYTWPRDEELLGSEIASQRDPQADSFGLLARLEDRVVLLESQPDAESAAEAKSLGTFAGTPDLFVTEVRLPDELAKADGITFARDPAANGTYVALANNYIHDRERVGWLKFDQAGQLVERAEYDNSPDDNVVELGNAPAAFIPPATYLIGVMIMAVETDRPGGLQYMWEQAKEDSKNTAVLVGLCTLQPLIGIPLAFWAARRRWLNKRQTGWWVLWAFFYGPCGGVAILAVYPRIAYEPCPACRKPTRIDSAHCEHCRHSLDDTPTIGIEIFDHDRDVMPETAATAST